MKCILHIGTEKTATTLLQDWLYANQKALSAQKIYLSEILEKTNNRAFPSFFQNHLDDWTKQHKINTQKEKERFFEGFLDRLRDEITEASNNHDVFVITSEHLHSRVTRHEDIQSIAKFLNDNFDETKVLCYFRNQFDMAVSQYSTLLKVSSADKIKDFIKQVQPNSYYYNFFDIAENWSRAFGVANCVFKVYDKALFIDNDIRKDFLSELLPEIELIGINFEINSANESLTRLQGAAFRSVNKLIPYWDKINGGFNSLNVLLKRKISQIKGLRYGKITSKARSEVERRFKNSNQKFFSKYFTDTSHFSSRNDESKDVATFGIDEVENLVCDVFDTILPLVSTMGNLRDGDANYLRDIAVKIEKGSTLSIRDASDLMKLASRARPGGSFIAKKVAQYKNQLDLEKLDKQSD